MFEDYEVHAKRSIFFAKKTAREYESAYVELDHLLIGILREVPQVLMDIITIPANQFLFEAENLAKERQRRGGGAASSESSLDTPVGAETIRVLEHAAEEAEHAGQDKINPIHLLTGIQREKATGAAQLLETHGVTLPKLRARFAYWELAMQPGPLTPPEVTVSQAGLRLGPEILFVLQDGRAICSTVTLDYVPRLKERLRLSLERGYTSEFTVVDVRYDYKIVDVTEVGSVQRLKTVVIYLKPRHGHDEEEYSSLT